VRRETNLRRGLGALQRKRTLGVHHEHGTNWEPWLVTPSYFPMGNSVGLSGGMDAIFSNSG